MSEKPKKIILLFLILIIISCQKNKSDSFFNLKNILKSKDLKKNEAYGVINVNRLRFRSENDIHSKTLMYLDKGDLVTVLKKDNERVNVGEMEDFWYQIEFKGTTGWIFGYFVDIYSSLEDAEKNSKKYLEDKFGENKKTIVDDYIINKNLFFINNGKIFQVTDVKNKQFKKLNTYQDNIITDYFFNKDGYTIFYLSKKNFNDNGLLYLYNLNNSKNQLIESNIYAADINENSNVLILLSKYKNKYWQVSIRSLDLKSSAKNLANINLGKEIEILKVDAFTQSIAREKSSLVYLKYDEKGNVIYFKPPEEKSIYIISASNGAYIKTDKEQETNFYIDVSQYITVVSSEDSKSGIIYNIILNDKFSGRQKELISSNLFPINFSISPKKNYLAITMLDLTKTIDNYYYSSVYILSLTTYTLIDISTDGKSYQTKWSNKLIN